MPSRLPQLPAGAFVGLTSAASGGQRRFATGHQAIDAAFGGGLAAGRLHEVYGEGAAGPGFAAMLALCAGRDAPMLWIRTDAAERAQGGLYAAGFAELGGDPRRLFLARVRDADALLRAAADATRCSAIGVAVAEWWGPSSAYDLNASRRLVLAAEASGVTLILARGGAPPVPSAAETRWFARSAPSVALQGDAPGRPMLVLELLRRRAGPAGLTWHVEWNRDRRSFVQPPLSGAVVPVSADRAAGLRRVG